MQGVIRVIVGLGNPGEAYRDTRHNIGFRVVEALARRHGDGDWAERESTSEFSGRIGKNQVTLARPSTFMNRSGKAVGGLLKREGLPPDSMLVIVDDIDLPVGRLRLRPRGGPGTHNGLRDIGRAIGNDYPRLRVGVGRASSGQDLADFVLSPFADTEQSLVERVVEVASDAVEAAVLEGVEAAMSRFNGVEVEAPDGSVTEPVPPTFGRAKPVRLAPWFEGEQGVVVEFPQPDGRGPATWVSWLRWWTGPSRIGLDDHGSAVWRRMDGRKTVNDIAADLSEDEEQLRVRIEIFVRTLVNQGLARLEFETEE